MAIIADTNLAMIRGDTYAFGVEIEDLDQELETAYFSCKETASDEDYIFQKTLNDGISLVETGKYRVRIAPEDTVNLKAKSYRYDLQIGVNGDIYTVLKGELNIAEDITREV